MAIRRSPITTSVEYRHTAPVKVPAADVTPEAMHEVIRRIEAIVDPARGVLSPELSKDICRLLASRQREWLRADAAERRECGAYIDGRNDAARAMQFDWWERRARDWRAEYQRLLLSAGGPASRDAALRASHSHFLATSIAQAASATVQRGREAPTAPAGEG